MDAAPVIYQIDRDDRLVEVNEEWSRFALANGAVNLAGSQVLGRSLWDFIGDPVVRDLYTQVLGRAREGRVIRYQFRCDSPTMKRVFEMEVTAAGEGGALFRSTLVKEEERAPESVPEEEFPMEGRFLKVCSWCHAMAWPGGAWAPLEEAADRLGDAEGGTVPVLTHGICDACALKMQELLANS